MTRELHDLLAILGLVVAVAGVLAVLYQLRQVERGLRSSASGACLAEPRFRIPPPGVVFTAIETRKGTRI